MLFYHVWGALVNTIENISFLYEVHISVGRDKKENQQKTETVNYVLLSGNKLSKLYTTMGKRRELKVPLNNGKMKSSNLKINDVINIIQKKEFMQILERGGGIGQKGYLRERQKESLKQRTLDEYI